MLMNKTSLGYAGLGIALGLLGVGGSTLAHADSSPTGTQTTTATEVKTGTIVSDIAQQTDNANAQSGTIVGSSDNTNGAGTQVSQTPQTGINANQTPSYLVPTILATGMTASTLLWGIKRLDDNQTVNETQGVF